MDPESNSRVALLSIHPEWADAILDGRKTVEFRKVQPKDPVGHVVIYATKPVSQVVGYFSVGGIDVASPSRLWNDHGRNGSISRTRFRRYFASRRQGVAIKIDKVSRLEHPLPLGDLGVSAPPQSFVYLGNTEFAALSQAT